MKCPHCGGEMLNGRFSEFFSWGPQTLRFHPNDKTQQKKKVNGWITPQAWYCKQCNKIIASFDAKDAIV